MRNLTCYYRYSSRTLQNKFKPISVQQAPVLCTVFFLAITGIDILNIIRSN
ncbi:hypothetical protein I3843_10G090700 [Carya illinoinensis]|nr:hypothetical protein I3843_10G090700 [Carya illinoinensis]